MRVANLFAGFLMLVALFATAVPTASAAGTCFCNVTGQGATQQTSGASAAAACRTVCAAQPAAQGSLWASDASGYPSSLLQCFSKKEQCEKDMDGDGVNDGKWDVGSQPAECPSGWHYCYPVDSETYTLQISIPNASGSPTTNVSNYGQYIGAVYKYLLGFSVTIAIVFMMIGGIRYVIGASTGDIGKAKGMIMKAVVGLVLLMSAYVILYTVNPELVSLQVPKLPMLRRVDILTGGETCDRLRDAGYVLDPDSISKGRYGAGSCGSTAAIMTRPDGSPETNGATCMFSDCHGNSEGGSGTTQCVSDGTSGWCLSCEQVVPRNSFNVAPSAGLCTSLDPDDSYVNLVEPDPAYDVYKTCGYTHDPWMFSSGLGVTTASAATAVAGAVAGGTAAGVVALGYSSLVGSDAVVGSCVSMEIDCKQVTGCEGYNSASVANTITDTTLPYLNWNSLGDPNIVEVCATDPCRIGATTGVACAYYGAEDTSQIGVETGCFPVGHSGADDYTDYPAGP